MLCLECGNACVKGCLCFLVRADSAELEHFRLAFEHLFKLVLHALCAELTVGAPRCGDYLAALMGIFNVGDRRVKLVIPLDRYDIT